MKSQITAIGLFLIFMGNFAQSQPLPTPVFGRYIGVLKHTHLGKEQLAKLDFIVSRTKENDLELKAVLTLHFGDFKSGEYVSYHYDKVNYNFFTGALVFDNVEQPLSILVNRFSGGALLGEVTSLWTGKMGQLVLSSAKTAVPQAPLIEALWGEYSGGCGLYPAKLQIYTYRSSSDSAHTAQPYGAYNIRANLPIACQDGVCTTIRFTSGSYNFLAKKEQLSLVGPWLGMTCDINGDDFTCRALKSLIPNGLDLSHCKFRRTSKETALPRQLSPIENVSAFEKTPSDLKPEELTGLQGGEYRGYVFHEYLGKYQSASLDLSVFHLSSGTQISSNARLFFGDHDSPEVIPYRFGAITYPNPIAGPNNLVLEKMASNLDAIIQITEAKNGVIRGVWHSVTFGRVGPFELRKNELPLLPVGAQKIERLTGTYRGPSLWPNSPNYFWVIRLQIIPGITPPTTSENPFFPNLLRGVMHLNEGIIASQSISDGSYDFYTGRFGFSHVTENSPDHAWIGYQNNRGELLLHQASLQPVTTTLKHRPMVFKLLEEVQ